MAGNRNDRLGRKATPNAIRAASARPSAEAIAELLEVARDYIERLERPDLGSVVVQSILEIDPGNARALELAGMAAQRIDRPDEAEFLYSAASEADPADPSPHSRLAGLLAAHGRTAEALDHLDTARRLDPADARLWLETGRQLFRLDRVDDADRAFEQALLIDPAFGEAAQERLDLNLALGRLDVATAELRRSFGVWYAGAAAPAFDHAAGRVMSVKAWCAESGAKYVPLDPAGFELIHPPRYCGGGVAPAPVAPAPVPAARPETYVAVIPDARLVGGESLILTDSGDILQDLSAHPDAARIDFEERVFRSVKGVLGVVSAAADDAPPLDAAIGLTNVSSYNYFHWMVEVLPRLRALELADGAVDVAGLPIVIDERPLRVPQLVATLRAICPDRELIPLAEGKIRRIRRLVVPSHLSWIANNLRDGELLRADDAIVSEAAIRFLRSRLAPPGLNLEGPGHRRFFIAKSGASRMIGSAELDRVLAESDLEDIRPESLSFPEQVALFADADTIVAESGAALTNLVFAPPTVKTVVLTGDRWVATWFSQIAAVLGQTMLYVAGTVVEPSRKTYQSRFTIDPADLRAALDEVS